VDGASKGLSFGIDAIDSAGFVDCGAISGSELLDSSGK
jgi:hypothetical protein